MAIINNNVQNVSFLRNQAPFATREAALSALETAKANAIDGSSLLARYTDEGVVKTLVGYVYVSGATHDITVIDVQGASGDVEALRQEINAKLGDSFITSGNTVEANLTALSGTSADGSGVTSVWGAKAYADNLIETLDYTDEAVAGQYVSQVTQADGKIAVTRVELPSSADTAEAKKVVIAVSEDKGQIEVSRGSITSSGKTIVLTDNADGGVNFEANVDGTTIIVDENTGTMSVASSALVQYEGDNKTIAISEVENAVRTVSSLITLSSVTPSSEVVKEEYALKNASGETIGSTIKIYKDSHIVSITYITDTGDTHYQNLEYVYIDASGNTQTEYVDMSELVLEAEFASGLTIENHVARGVVDPQSEKDSQDTPVDFLTVGADGFKINGIKDEIDRKLAAIVENLDADESGSTEHITVNVVEEDGEITTVTVEEDNIANADDLAELSGKTITAITSSNGSIDADIDEAVGNKSYDLVTDASKIKMSGFTSTDALSGITTNDSISDAFEKVDAVITENERVTAAALTDLDDKIDTVSGDVDTIKNEYISGVSVNGNAVTVANKVAPISITAATSATTATSTEAITVQTDANGNITLGLSNIDCGYYA